MAQISHGMNIGEVRSLGGRLQSHYAESIRGLMREMEQLVNNTSTMWVGPDAEAFRSWWPEKRAALTAIAEDLHGFGQSALNNANEQESVSGR
jgi:uncharacterized protein YukE